MLPFATNAWLHDTNEKVRVTVVRGSSCLVPLNARQLTPPTLIPLIIGLIVLLVILAGSSPDGLGDDGEVQRGDPGSL